MFLSEAVNRSFKTSQLPSLHILRASVHTSWGQIYLLILRILNFKESRKFTYKWRSFQVLAWIFLYHQLIGQAALLSHHTRKWKTNLRATSDFWDNTYGHSQLKVTQASWLKMKAFSLGIPLASLSRPVMQTIQNIDQSHNNCRAVVGGGGCQVFMKMVALPSKSWSQEHKRVDHEDLSKEDWRRMEEVFDITSIRGSWEGEKKTLRYTNM